jgi:hypothetical protein
MNAAMGLEEETFVQCKAGDYGGYVPESALMVTPNATTHRVASDPRLLRD